MYLADLKTKNKATLEFKSNFIRNFFCIVYINFLKMSDSFSDAMPFLYVSFKLRRVNK